MHINIRTIILMLAVAAVAILSPAGGRQAQLQQIGGVIQPDVIAALQQDDEVAVIINLAAPETLLAAADMSAMMANTGARQAAVLSSLTGADFTVAHEYQVIPALAGMINADGVAKLDGHPDVLNVSLSATAYPLLGESSPLIGGDQVHLEGFDGTGIKVAVIDSGIDTDHPDLLDSIIGEKCFITQTLPPPFDLWQLCPDDPRHLMYDPDHPAEDDRGHGSHVSGIITGNGVNLPPGIAPGASIFAYKYMTFNGLGEEMDVVAALDDIIVRNFNGDHTDFINMSFGLLEESFGPGDCPGQNDDEHEAMRASVDFLRINQGTLTFAASGNDGFRDAIRFPACLTEVVAVGAVYDADVGSSGIACTDAETAPDQVPCFSQSSEDLELLAPGSVILSAYPNRPGYSSKDLTREVSGTSMASPHAIGVAALLKEALPGITADEIVDVLKDTGVPVIDDYDPANVRTTPRVDAVAAVLDDDLDLDGCTNGQEFGDNEYDGGLRNPEYFWDFYDVWTHTSGIWERDGFVTLADILAVAARFGPGGFLPKEVALAQALVPPTDSNSYHPDYDRGPFIGPNPWDKGPPDGTIAISDDILAVAAQFGHSCG